MKTIADLKAMIEHPIGKEFHKKYGTPKSAVLKKKSKYPNKFTSEKEQDTGNSYKPYK